MLTERRLSNSRWSGVRPCEGESIVLIGKTGLLARVSSKGLRSRLLKPGLESRRRR